MKQNKENLEAIMTIVKAMGWQKMPARVSISAVKRMVFNNCCVIADCTEDLLNPEEELHILADMVEMQLLSAEDLWLKLFVDDYDSCNDIGMQNRALAMRKEIEKEMFNGVFFQDACNMAAL